MGLLWEGDHFPFWECDINFGRYSGITLISIRSKWKNQDIYNLILIPVEVPERLDISYVFPNFVAGICSLYLILLVYKSNQAKLNQGLCPIN